MKRRGGLAMSGAAMMMVMGCATIPRALDPVAEGALRDRAEEALKRAVRYEHAGSVRAFGIEVMQRRLGEEGLPWIRNALLDESAGVRFAAIMALGTLGDAHSHERIRSVADGDDQHLEVAALYALHRLGDTSRSARLPKLLLESPSAEVRESVALVLGLLGEPGALKLLARAMKDQDDAVQRQALESMALLGNREAIQQLTFSASSGLGFQRVSAINTLADLATPSLEDTFRYKLEQGEYIETRLAAARALGELNNDAGLRVALGGLRFDNPQLGVSQDPPGEQIWRVRQLAALALGAIGDRRALGPLGRLLNGSSDPRLQVVAADAILGILEADPSYGRSRRRARGVARGD